MKNNRPLSPHLTIYKPQMSSVLSIMHRITGTALFVGALLLVWWIVGGVYSSFNPKVMLWEFWGSVIGKGLLLLWSIALFYHLLNGIRHLFWDVGMGFKVSTADKTGLLVLVGAVLLTALSWFLALV